jgi:CheY-like chemotaxis protein
MADGDPGFLEMARINVSSLNWCDLSTAHDGHVAAERLQSQKFDGLIMADRIPNVDGFELIQRVKASPINASIPIVMLTAEDDLNTMRKGFKAGVTFFCTKPTTRDRFNRLFNAVHGAMESERRRHNRLPYRTRVTCNLGDERGSRFVAESGEISEGGMSVKPSGGVKVGQILELEFLLPQISRPANPTTRRSQKILFAERETSISGPQKIRAKVCYAAPSGEAMGLDFVGITPAQREVIRHYIAGGS